MAILPALIDFKFNRDIARKWFNADALHEIDDVFFDTDNAGNWMGTWSTIDDETNQMIMDEDMGVSLALEGLDLLQAAAEDATHLTADDATANGSHSSIWGASRAPPPVLQSASNDGNQQCEGEATPPASDSAADPAPVTGEVGGAAL